MEIPEDRPVPINCHKAYKGRLGSPPSVRSFVRLLTNDGMALITAGVQLATRFHYPC